MLLGIVATMLPDLVVKTFFEREKYLVLHFCIFSITCAAFLFTRGIIFFPQVYSLVQEVQAREEIPSYWKYNPRRKPQS